MNKEIKKYYITPLVQDELRGNVYRIGCYKFIDELCNFVGVTVGTHKITEYSFAKYGASVNERASEISEENYKLICDFIKQTYTTVVDLIHFAPIDNDSNCYYMENGSTIYMINESPDSEWHNFELIKRDIPNIFIPNDITVSTAKEKLEHRKIPEFLFFGIMDFIQHNLTLITRLVHSYCK